MKLYLIRHGRTIGNEKHLYYGSTDLPLLDSGVEELMSLREAWNSCVAQSKNPVFVTSGMLRTRQTMGTLFGDKDFSIVRDFREIDFGCFEMKSYDELKDRDDYQAWISGDFYMNVPPKGESGVQMKERVDAAFATVLKENKDTVLIVHGGTISLIMTYLFPEENKNMYEWQPLPGHGYVIDTDAMTYSSAP